MHDKNSMLSRKMSYVHCSGGMFALIPSYEQEAENRPRNSSVVMQQEAVRNPTDIRSSTPCQHKAYFGSRGGIRLEITGIYPCEASGLAAEQTDNEICIGFYWVWNHQLPKKWRGQFTGDDMFQDRSLEDFRRFCYAQDDRLMSLFHNFLQRCPP
ncbi:hypothetical protein Ciccas_013239 [Cichlidogyrus casuarinus]|uniref:DEPDC5 C-terminal domain-containing protein n=1 Tax=Cichlidogyrus casuarinus TaxID=1844966 RepID=A0ABD2PNE7_9PLAT